MQNAVLLEPYWRQIPYEQLPRYIRKELEELEECTFHPGRSTGTQGERGGSANARGSIGKLGVVRKYKAMHKIGHTRATEAVAGEDINHRGHGDTFGLKGGYGWERGEWKKAEKSEEEEGEKKSGKKRLWGWKFRFRSRSNC
jgi:hypothetical protein